MTKQEESKIKQNENSKRYNERHPERRKAQYLECWNRRKAEMTPEQLEAFREAKVAYDMEYRAKNAEKRKAQRKAYLPKQRELMQTPKHQAWRKAHYEKNKAKLTKQVYARHTERLKEDVVYRIATRARARIRAVLRNKARSQSSLELIGCTPAELWDHLAKQFKPGMTMANYGTSGWVIDHVIPISAFLLTDAEQMKRAFHYTNLQPLWAIENLKKHAKLPPGVPHPNPPCQRAADEPSVPPCQSTT